MVKSKNPSYRVLPESWPRIVAHRGASSLAPENTLAAFSIARTLGVRAVELDVHLCGTGELVVIHDHGLKRLAGVDGTVANTPWSVLSGLDVGSHFSTDYSSERVPTLDMVIETLGPDIGIDVEIKTSDRMVYQAAIEVHRVLSRHGRDNCIVSSFNPLAILAYRRVGPLPTAAIYCNHTSVPWYLRHRECVFFGRPDILKPAEALAVTGDNYRPALVWTVDDRARGEALLASGTRSIITNRIQDYPELY